MNFKLIAAYLWWVALVVPTVLFAVISDAIKQSHSSSIRLLLFCILVGMFWAMVVAIIKTHAWSKQVRHKNRPDVKRRNNLRIVRPPRS